MNNFIFNIWYKNNPLFWLLLPLTAIFCLVVFLRRFLYKKNILRVYKFSVPIIIIGNITVGGTGKTPLTIWLANYLLAQGFKPGIVSRGYGRKNKGVNLVTENSEVVKVGDEALLIRKRTNVPFIVARDRVLAVEKLLDIYDCDIILSDDGLQHYSLDREVEIVVIDGERRFGNRFCLPAGPLREPIKRLTEVNFVVVNGGTVTKNEYAIQLTADKFYNVADPNISKELKEFSGKTVHGLAGIGNPSRFFVSLKELGIDVIEHPFPDHHDFKPKEIDFDDDLLIIMTEKDAVKCKKFANEKHWFLSVTAKPDDRFIENLMKMIKREYY